MSRLRLRLVAAIALACLVVGGCSSAHIQVAPDGPYKAQILQAQKSATSDMEHKILADGVITKAEYDEAVNMFVKCLNDQGVEIKAVDNGYGFDQYVYPSQYDAQVDKLTPGCRKGTTAVIEELYANMLTNPTGGDIYDVTVDCLKRHGLVSADFTAAQLKSLNLADPAQRNLPYDRDDPDAVACNANASH